MLGFIPGSVRGHGDDFSRCNERPENVPVEAVLDEYTGSWSFELPRDGLAVRILDLEIDPSMGILVDDLRDLADQCQRLGLIVFGLKRMVSRRWDRHGGQADHERKSGCSHLHRKLLQKTPSIHCDCAAGTRTTRKPISLTLRVGP